MASISWLHVWRRWRQSRVDELVEEFEKARKLGVAGDPFYNDLPRRQAVNERADGERQGSNWLGPNRRGWLR